MEFIVGCYRAFKEMGLPVEVLFAVVAVVFATEATKGLLGMLEDYLEAKKNKQIKIFDHKKVLLLIIWSCIISCCLAFAKVYVWRKVPLYAITLTGAGSACYELVIKRFKGEQNS